MVIKYTPAIALSFIIIYPSAPASSQDLDIFSTDPIYQKDGHDDEDKDEDSDDKDDEGIRDKDEEREENDNDDEDEESAELEFLDLQLSNPDNVQKRNQRSMEKIKAGIAIKHPQLKISKPSLIKKNDDITIDRGWMITDEPNFITVTENAEDGTKIKHNQKLIEAYRAARLGHETTAIMWFSEIIKEDDENFSALFGLARTYHRSKQLDQSKYVYSRILELYPNHTQTLNNMIVLITEQSPKYALDQLESIEAVNPNYSQIFMQKGLIYLKMGDFETASKEFINAVSLEPNNYNYQYNLALSYDKMGKPDVAIYFYRRILKAHEDGRDVSGDIRAVKKRYLYLKETTILKEGNTNGVNRAS